MRAPFGLLVQSHTNNCRALLVIDLPMTTGPGRVLLDARQAALRIAFPPTSGLVSRNAHDLRDLNVLETVGSVQHDRGALSKTDFNTPPNPQSLKCFAFGVIQRNLNRSFHDKTYAPSCRMLH